jgi:16S rRNA (cytosine967-C5)-methyltransferase
LDIHSFKHHILEERISQYRLSNVHPIVGDVAKLDDLVVGGKIPSTFFAALIDAPCSGTGTMRRNPEIRWRLTPSEVSSMAAQGLSMLESVAKHIAQDGFVVYSTCSALKEENEQVIETFLLSDCGKDFSIEPCGSEGANYFRSALSPGSADSHFAAKLVRRR